MNSLPQVIDADSDAWRHSGRDAMARALQASRSDTLAAFALYEAHLPSLSVPERGDLTPPLWELGHIGWFAQHWLARNPQRHQGWDADPDAPRSPALPPDNDGLFDSSRVAHQTRWQLPLPDADALRASLAQGLQRNIELLDGCDEDDRGLYFHRLVLAHEDMHHEAAVYMGQALGLPMELALSDSHRPLVRTAQGAARQLDFDAGPFDLGRSGGGFAFDNELGAHPVGLSATRIDERVVNWSEFLPFVQAGGYTQARWWCDEGRAWLAGSGANGPRYLRANGKAWQQQRFGQWVDLDLSLPACHLNAFEAQAWCRWAGRRLPSEAEWERAAVMAGSDLQWGEVWEWTASEFAPYPGFAPHPYRDYSAPWFGSRRVLRGASVATQPRLHDLRYRNFYTPERNDIFAGFRSCAL